MKITGITVSRDTRWFCLIPLYTILKLVGWEGMRNFCLSTIYFYIILKRIRENGTKDASLSTIYFYIILKPQIQK